jgi:hypothetical protein
VDDWMDEAAYALGEQSLLPEEVAVVLRLARDVAHGVERKMAPIAAFLVGAAAGRAVASGSGHRLKELRAAVETIRPLIPAAGEDGT